jgi:hypothetical protein
MWRIDKTFILFVLTVIATIVYSLAGLALFAVYLVAVALRIKGKTIYMSFGKMMWYYFLLDSLNLVYFFTFYPRTIKEEYVAVNSGVLQEN